VLTSVGLSLLATGDSGSAAAQLLENGTFTGDATPWTASSDGGASTELWSAGSDSVTITDAMSTTVIVTQCVPATAGKSYTATGDVLIPTANQHAATIANAGFTWFDDAVCAETDLGADASAPVVQNASWQCLSVTAAAPASTAGVRSGAVPRC
jgi:hypothetical protein